MMMRRHIQNIKEAVLYTTILFVGATLVVAIRFYGVRLLEYLF